MIGTMDKFTAYLKKILQYLLFGVLILFACSLAIDSILAATIMVMASLLVLPAVRDKFLPEALRHPLLTTILIIAVVIFATDTSDKSSQMKIQKAQQEMAQIAQEEKEKAIADFASNPQPKIEEIKDLIEQKIYGGARNQIDYYKESGNEDLKALDAQLSKIEEKIQEEQQAIAEKAAEEQRAIAEKMAEEQRIAKAAELWSYSHIDDPMSKGVTHTASIQSSNTVNFDFPYSGAQHGRLALRTDPKYGKDVIFSIEKGQILCPSYNGCAVRVRFDDQDAVTYSAVGAADNSTETIFIHNYSGFLSRMLKAKRVRISMNIYQEGSPVFDFDISGFNKDKYLPKKVGSDL